MFIMKESNLIMGADNMLNEEKTELVRVDFVDRIKHVYSVMRTNDEELQFARSINEPVETITIAMDETEDTVVTVSTVQAVYEFHTFKSTYVGHASRTLVELLEHFGLRISLDFLLSHPVLTVYLNGNKIVSNDAEFRIEPRNGVFELVEPVNWMISTSILNILEQIATEHESLPEEVVENGVAILELILRLSGEYEIDPLTFVQNALDLLRTNQPSVDSVDTDTEEILAT